MDSLSDSLEILRGGSRTVAERLNRLLAAVRGPVPEQPSPAAARPTPAAARPTPAGLFLPIDSTAFNLQEAQSKLDELEKLIGNLDGPTPRGKVGFNG